MFPLPHTPNGFESQPTSRAMSRDPEFYPSPDEFLPERFLGVDRQQDPKEFAFGSGRRFVFSLSLSIPPSETDFFNDSDYVLVWASQMRC
jgi:hypothetical protein